MPVHSRSLPPGRPPAQPAAAPVQAHCGRSPAVRPSGQHLAPAGRGKPLPEAVRGKMERALGHDFSRVRVHEGGHAESLGALAYTRGTDLHFAPGRYSPSTRSGQELIGHELTHVVQQQAGRVAVPQGKGAPINADPALEAEADRLGASAARGDTVAGRAAARAPSPRSSQSVLQPASPIQLADVGPNNDELNRLLGVVPLQQQFVNAGLPAPMAAALAGQAAAGAAPAAAMAAAGVPIPGGGGGGGAAPAAAAAAGGGGGGAPRRRHFPRLARPRRPPRVRMPRGRPFNPRFR